MGIIGILPPPPLVVEGRLELALGSDDCAVVEGTTAVPFISAESGGIDINVAMVSVSGPVTDG